MSISQYANILPTSGRQVSIMKRFFFEELGILPSSNSRHELAGLFQLLLFMFSRKLSAEEASIEMKVEFPDSLVSSADTLLRRLKETDEAQIQKAFDNCTKRLLKNLAKQKCTVAIDYHDIPYYGSKNDVHVRGTKHQRGTNWCHQYATLEISDGEHRLTLAVKPLSVNDDEKALVIKELINIARKHVQISVILLDRGFYGIECIRALKQLRFPYVMPVVKDAKMKPFMQENVKNVPGVVQYTIGKKGNCETFNLALKWLEKKDAPPDIVGFATNTNLTVEEISNLYSKRWSIETGYRTKKQFRARTTTRNNVVRSLYFFFECLLYNAWYMTRTTIRVTIAMFKCVIEHIATTAGIIVDGVT